MMRETAIKPGYCSETVRGGDWGGRTPCSRKATVEREGAGYCKQHDPVRRKELRDEKEKKWRAERAPYRERVARRAACFEALEGWADPSAAGELLDEITKIMPLLDAIQEDHVALMPSGVATFNKLRAAIAKARGKS